MKRRLAIVLLFLTICSLRLGAQQINCQLFNADQVLFGTYSSSLIRVTTSININCDAGAKYTIGLGQGSHGTSVTNRLMANGTQTLSYQLFSDASYTLNWGDASSTYPGVSGTGAGSQSIRVYAQVPANQFFFKKADGGNYSDNVSITLTCSNCKVISGSPGNLGVNLNGVAEGCGISASNLNFGNYTGALLSASTTLQVGCTGGTTYNVGLNVGAGAGATFTSRKMTGPANALLNYNLCRDSGCSLIWGNTVGTNTQPGTGTNAIQNLTVYGQIPAGQSAVIGSYTDTIVATLTY